MRIAVVSTFYSPGMGYTENCLPAALARRGHEVHLITSRLNVYGNSPDYDRNYASFLGPREVDAGSHERDGYAVHRLEYRLVAGYVALRGLTGFVRRLAPDVVHSTAVVSLASYAIAALRPIANFRFFTECHQHLSVVQPYLLNGSGGHWTKRTVFRLTRTLPGSVVGLASERCYAIAPDCALVAKELYGISERKVSVQSLGTDTVLFRPGVSQQDLADRALAREALGYPPDAIVCVYTGRLTEEKNPLLLAEAVSRLAADGGSFHSLFVGEGVQREAILACRNSTVLSFMPHSKLAELYRMTDVAVWPRQESMSMLDAAASGLPIVASSSIGDPDRIIGNGALYAENDVIDLMRVLLDLADRPNRIALGEAGRIKMIDRFSWDAIAMALTDDYEHALMPSGS